MRPLPLILGAAVGAVAAPAVAADLSVTLTVPTISTAAYHRPYVAVWIEREADDVPMFTIGLWYEAGATARGDGDGEQYLKDIRTWWRKGGRATTLPIAGVTGPTRAPGRYTITAPAARMASLPAGQYEVVVQAAREQGGVEAVRVPFTWGGAANSASASGTVELGAVSVSVTR